MWRSINKYFIVFIILVVVFSIKKHRFGKNISVTQLQPVLDIAKINIFVPDNCVDDGIVCLGVQLVIYKVTTRRSLLAWCP